MFTISNESYLYIKPHYLTLFHTIAIFQRSLKASSVGEADGARQRDEIQSREPPETNGRDVERYS